jgi:hypothetical protein
VRRVSSTSRQASPHGGRGTEGEIIRTHLPADKGADRLGRGRQLQPVVEATDRIGLDMASGDVAQLGGIDQRGHGVAHEDLLTEPERR